MTPEQRERVRMILQSDADRFRRVAEAREDDDLDAHRKAAGRVEAVTLACELLTPEAEADRRLGSLARACRADLVGPLELLADALERSTFHVPGCARLNRDRAASLRELAAALREESER